MHPPPSQPKFTQTDEIEITRMTCITSEHVTVVDDHEGGALWRRDCFACEESETGNVLVKYKLEDKDICDGDWGGSGDDSYVLTDFLECSW